MCEEMITGELAPFYNTDNHKVDFFSVDYPVITVENSTFNNAKLCGIINTAIRRIIEERNYNLSDSQIRLLVDFLYITANLDVFDYGVPNNSIIDTLYKKANVIWK